MSGAIKNVIVIGAGGLAGGHIVEALQKSAYGYSVSVLSREESSYTPPTGVASIKTDYTHDSLVKALKGQNAIVSTIAGSALLKQIDIINAAIEAGVQRFIPSEFGSDTGNAHCRSRVPFFPPKHQVAEYLREKQEKIEWTIIQSGPFFELCLETGFLGFDIANNAANTWDDKYKDVKFASTRRSTVGQAVAEALSPAIAPKTVNQTLFIQDTTATISTLFAALEKSTGSTWTVNKVDYDALVAESMEKLKVGDLSGIGPIIIGNCIDPESGNDFAGRGILSNELLSIPEADLQALVDESVARVKATK
ncbi:hypothetical protein FQN54_002175 [Arachnomyces sp. PD_36]|nr:hypothetical protein FQN54_002175 [Arachnomyces sp. PD_36]